MNGRFLFALFIVALLPCCSEPMREDVAAQVDGRPITFEALTMLQRSWKENRKTDQKDGKLRRLALNQLIEEELILIQAEKTGVTIPEATIEVRIKEIMADYPGTAFQDMLVREYLDLKSWKERIKRQEILKKVIENELQSRIKTDSQEWEAFFLAHRPQAPATGRLKLRHITLGSREEAETARGKIKTPRDFVRISEEKFGTGPGAKEDQPIWVYPDLLPDNLGPALWETKVGGITPVLETPGGFSIFLVLEAEPVQAGAAEKVMTEIHKLYLKSLRERAYHQWLTELKSKARISINPVISQ